MTRSININKGIVGKVCPSCEYIRDAQDKAPRHRCPSCGEAYFISESHGKKKEEIDAGLKAKQPKYSNKLGFVAEAIRDLPETEADKPDKDVAARSFFDRAAYSYQLGVKEPELFVFGILQWASIGVGYFLWIQMLDWIPESVWRTAAESDRTSIADIILFLWSFLCVGVAAFPLGVFSACMACVHFLHKEGFESTTKACLQIVLPNAWKLWVFHWLDGWITVNQIMERLPRKNDRRTPQDRAMSELLYYAWKLGISGVLPGIIAGRSLRLSGVESVNFVKVKFKDVAKIRVGYSFLCWVVGISTYILAIFMFMLFDIVPEGKEVYGSMYKIYFWIGAPLMAAVAVIQLCIRPVYLISLSDIYSDYLSENDRHMNLYHGSKLLNGAVISFGIIALTIGLLVVFRYEVGLMDALSSAKYE